MVKKLGSLYFPPVNEKEVKIVFGGLFLICY